MCDTDNLADTDNVDYHIFLLVRDDFELDRQPHKIALKDN